MVRIFFSLSLWTKTRASFERYIFSLLFLTSPEKRETYREEERKEEEREERTTIFSREKDTREKKQKKEKKTAHKLCSHSGTCTRKQMKEGTERENGDNAVDACVRFWFSSARDWLFLRWKTQSFFFLFGGKGCFYITIQEKRRREEEISSRVGTGCFWLTRTKRKKNQLDMKNNFFFFRLNRVRFQIELSGFQPQSRHP